MHFVFQPYYFVVFWFYFKVAEDYVKGYSNNALVRELVAKKVVGLVLPYSVHLHGSSGEELISKAKKRADRSVLSVPHV